MWHFGTWFNGGLGSVWITFTVDDLKGLLQPKWFYDSDPPKYVCMLYLAAAESFGGFEQVKSLWRKCLGFFPLKAECLLSRVNLRNTKSLPCALKLTHIILPHRVIPFSSAALFHMKKKSFHKHWNKTWLLTEVKSLSHQLSFPSHLCPYLSPQSPLYPWCMHVLYAQISVRCAKDLCADRLADTYALLAFPSTEALPPPLFR